nr:hypothetical protein [Tanacetum cinerariifolium]
MSTDKESSAAGTDNRPPMLVESDYESWKIRIERYIRGKPLGNLIWRSIQNGPTPHPQITVTEGQGAAVVQVTIDKTDEEFTEIENNRELADIQATNILSQGLPRHVFNTLNQTRNGKEIWDNVELLMKDSRKSLQQKKEELFDKYERFCAIGNESIHDYFIRFQKLINDMKITQLDIPAHQMNTKFVNNLPPYWAKYVTNTLKKQEQSSSIVDPLTYLDSTTHHLAPTQPTNPPPSISSLTLPPQPAAQSSIDVMLATMNQIVNLLSGFQKQFPPTNNQLRTSSNSRSHATVHDRQIVPKTVQRKAPGNVGNTDSVRRKKRVKDSQYFKDKMLLMEAKEKGAVLDAEAKAFLTDVECTTPYDQPLAIMTTNIFEVSHEDAHDSNVDEGPHAAAAFMANLSSTSETNGATTSHVNEVHIDDNQIFDNVNHLLAHEMHQEEHLDSDVESDIDDNTIPYHQYQLDSKVQDVPTEVYWLPAEELATQKSNPPKPVTLFVHNRPALSKVRTQLLKIKDCFPAFETIIKRRTTPTFHEQGECHFVHTKKAFTEHVIPFYEHVKELVQSLDENLVKEVTEFMRIFDELDKEYEQCVIEKKKLQIEKKNLLIQNECLITDCIAKDICSIVLASDRDRPFSEELSSNYVRENSKVIELEAEILKQQQMLAESNKRWKLVICYNCRGEGHVSRQSKEKKRVKDSQYFKDKMLLMEAKEKGAILDAEAEAFLVDVECTAPYDQPLAITTTKNFKVSHEDAYDSDVDEGPHAAAAFMANLSSTSGTNGATTSHVNEVHTDDNQIFDNVNHLLAHEIHQEEHLDSDVESDIDDNMIPFHQYQLDSEVQDVLTEDIFCEQSMVNDSLRAELARSLGSSNLWYARQAKIAQPTLYDGHALLKPTNTPVRVHDNEELLVQAEVSRTKMSNRTGTIKPINYAELNALYSHFVPQKELSREQVYWLPAEELATQKSNPPKPVTLFVHTFPAPSKVHTQLLKLKDCFPAFETIIKQKTTPTFYEQGE